MDNFYNNVKKDFKENGMTEEEDQRFDEMAKLVEEGKIKDAQKLFAPLIGQYYKVK